MKCLYCGKQIARNATHDETTTLWHSRCSMKFFGTPKVPALDIDDHALHILAEESVNHGLTIPGVQKKLSLHLSVADDLRLTIVDYPTGYILKPCADEYEHLPEFENLAMRLAKTAGISTVENALIEMNDTLAYITKRVDRNFVKGEIVSMMAMEDFCQLAERLTIDKYRGSYEKCGKIVREYSSRPGIDLAELFIRVMFSYIIGNSDMHLKNFSLIESAPGSRLFSLSPVYDMLPVNVILPEDTEEMALTLNGKKRRIKRSDFMSLADSYNITENAANKMIRKMCSLEDRFLTICDESYLPKNAADEVKALISQRIKTLQGNL